MDLQYEQVWVQNEPRLLGHLDGGCKEWERQLRDLQRNIEELYKEVKARREETEIGLDGNADPCIPKSSQHSKSPSKHLSHHSNDHSYTPSHRNNGNGDFLHHYNNNDSAQHLSNSSRKPVVCQDHSANTLLRQHSNGWNDHVHSSNGFYNPVAHNNNGWRENAGQDPAMRELEEILNFCLGQTGEYMNSPATKQMPHSPVTNIHGIQSICKNDQKKNTPLNAALDKITPVSGQFSRCKDQVWRKSGVGRGKTWTVKANDGSEEVENMKNKAFCSGREWCSNPTDPAKVDERVSPFQVNTEAPPIPPRTTSWCRNNVTAADIDSPGHDTIPDRKCVSPSVLRKFGAMLKENEGKTLMDSGLVTTVVSADAKCVSSPPAKFQLNKLPLSVQKFSSHTWAERQQIQTAQRDSVGKTCLVNTWESAFAESASCSDCKVPQEHTSAQRLTESVECNDDIIQLINMLELEQRSSSCPKVWSSNHEQDVLQGSSLPSSVTITRPFSRPARQARRRPPSRWAARIPSIPTTRAPAEKQTSCSFSSQMETIIM